MVQRRLQNDLAAPRVPDQVRGLDIHLVEDGDEVGGQLLRARHGGTRRGAVTTDVVAHRPAPRHRGDDTVPRRQIQRRPVDEHHRLAAPRVDDPGAVATDGDAE